MSVDANMMLNLIQTTNLAANKTTSTKGDSETLQETSFTEMLSAVVNGEEKVATTESSQNLENSMMNTEGNEEVDLKEKLMQLILDLLSNENEEAEINVFDENQLTTLLKLLMENADAERLEQLESSDLSVEEYEDAMSLMSILMNMVMTTSQTPTQDTTLATEFVLVENETTNHPLQQMQLTQKRVEQNEEQASALVNLLKGLTESEEPLIQATATQVEMTQVKPTTDSTQSEEINVEEVKTVQVEVVKPQQSTSQNESENVKQEAPKFMGEVMQTSEESQSTKSMSDFEKAYQEMQAYPTNTTLNNRVELVKSDVVDVPQEGVEIDKIDVLNQISEGITSKNMIQEDFVIKLKPEGLGEIVVKLQSESNGKNILSLVVNNEDVKRILESDLQGLKAALSSTNVEVKEVVYDNQSQYFQESNFMDGNGFYQDREQSSRTNRYFSNELEEDELEVDTIEFVHKDSMIHQHI